MGIELYKRELERVRNSNTYKDCGVGMVIMSILSDAQEAISLGLDPTDKLNFVKFLVNEELMHKPAKGRYGAYDIIEVTYRHMSDGKSEVEYWVVLGSDDYPITVCDSVSEAEHVIESWLR